METTIHITYRKTQKGEWVAYGRSKDIKLGPIEIVKANGEVETKTIKRLGAPFNVAGVAMAYGYFEGAVGKVGRLGQDRRSKRFTPTHRGCPTGGNCSSFAGATYCWECGIGAR